MGHRLAFPLIALTAALISAPSTGSTFKVAPVTLTLDQKGSIQAVRIENAGAETARIQLRLYEWTQADGQDVLVPTREVVANPGIFSIPSHDAQMVRIGRLTVPTVSEKSYRLLIEEVPGDGPAYGQGVNVMLRISIPVFSATSIASSPKLEWHAHVAGSTKLDLLLENTGNQHIKLHKLALKSVAGDQVSGQFTGLLYVLPGATRRISIPLSGAVKAGDSFKLVASQDGTELQADIVVGPQSDVPIPH